MDYGLIGGKLGHSYSPQIHSAFFDYPYILKEMTEAELPEFLTKREFKGLNVTIPYKKSVIPFCDVLGDAARRIGSVNTLVVRPDGTLFGDNTDHYGMCYAIRRAGVDLTGKHVLILGSGGTSLTARVAAEDLGAAKITVVSRSGAVNYENVYNLTDVGAVINTTPVGMYPNNGVSPLDLSRFPQLSGLLDVVYNPYRTALRLQADALGIPSASGLDMLVAQGKRAGELFIGASISDEKLDQVCRRMAAQLTNVVLIGMPGCGKSTVGKAVAAALNREFLDADAVLEANAGMTIPEIFERFGEAHFRDLEHETLRELGKCGGKVIATGGGAVCFARNLPSLWQNGRVYLLTRDLTKLPLDGRPLSTSVERLLAMAIEREPYYSKAAHVTVDNNGAPKETAAAILRDFGREQ